MTDIGEGLLGRLNRGAASHPTRIEATVRVRPVPPEAGNARAITCS